jgi:aspartate racemase
MKTLGLLGGIGPESTIEYYRLLIERYRERANGEYPSIIINSINLNRIVEWMTEGEVGKVADYCSKEVERLVAAGADLGALCSNTPHIVFDQIKQRSKIPLVSIVEAAAQNARSLGLKTVGLFGTRFTMEAPFYPDVFSRVGIKVAIPTADEREFIHLKYMGELLNNNFLAETRERVLSIVDEMKIRDGVEGVILGGTELPLLLRADDHNGTLLIDTARVHVDALVDRMLTESV